MERFVRDMRSATRNNYAESGQGFESKNIDSWVQPVRDSVSECGGPPPFGLSVNSKRQRAAALQDAPRPCAYVPLFYVKIQDVRAAIQKISVAETKAVSESSHN